ncbi:hypothetical protein VE03_06112 [Pseudogymnoascus sp. 23342-1-I1]|nr:hypothetical protein VE03_06112 [Pseudogymnoascus sp. 23342-1-I1]
MAIDHFIISEQLFQPPANVPVDSEFAFLAKTVPRWPSLTKYSIEYSVVCPSGSWYFVPHPDNFRGPNTNDRSDKVRTYPDDKAMNNLLGAAGKAKRNMPVLQMLSLIVKTKDDNWEFDATWFNTGLFRIASRPRYMTKEAFFAGQNHMSGIGTQRGR